MAIRKKQEPDEYQKALCKFHKKSNRHVVVFEADISEDEKRRIFSDADHLRQCGNELPVSYTHLTLPTNREV